MRLEASLLHSLIHSLTHSFTHSSHSFIHSYKQAVPKGLLMPGPAKGYRHKTQTKWSSAQRKGLKNLRKSICHLLIPSREGCPWQQLRDARGSDLLLAATLKMHEPGKPQKNATLKNCTDQAWSWWGGWHFCTLFRGRALTATPGAPCPSPGTPLSCQGSPAPNSCRCG